MDKKNIRIKELERENAELRKENAELRIQIVALTKRIEELMARIEELERKLSLNSKNSSKPPSSDGLKKANRTKSLRESTHKFGGQEGHKGDTLRAVENPDITMEYNPETCEACGSELADVDTTKVVERQEIDVEITKKVIAHKVATKVCSCGKKNVGKAPQNVTAPVQFGSKIKALAVYLTSQCISKNRIQNMFLSMFGVKISDTTLIEFDQECAQKLTPFYQAVYDSIRTALVKHVDETGIRVAGKTEWLHVASTLLLTHYRVHEKRGNLPEGMTGTIVHDHWKPYFTLPNVIHALCNAHHLRELRALIDFDKEVWAQKMYDLLTKASKIAEPSKEEQSDISIQYDQIVQEGLAYHEKLGPFKKDSRKKHPGHNLLIRLRDFKAATLLFLYNPDVPFTNNQVERDIRMMKVHQKVSGSLRTKNGALALAINRSLVSTVQKQGKDLLECLNQVFNYTFDVSSLVPG